MCVLPQPQHLLCCLPICYKRKSLPEPDLVTSWLVLTRGRGQSQYPAQFFLEADRFCLFHCEQTEKWSKKCRLTLLCALFCNSYLFIFYNSSHSVSILECHGKKCFEKLVGPRQHMLRNSLIYDFIAFIRAYWHIITLFWVEPHCSF